VIAGVRKRHGVTGHPHRRAPAGKDPRHEQQKESRPWLQARHQFHGGKTPMSLRRIAAAGESRMVSYVVSSIGMA
jgi:hypothetical protein